MSTTTWSGHERPALLRMVDAAIRFKSRLGLSPGPISARRVLERAMRRAGSDDLGEGDVVEPLRLLAHDFEHEAKLSPLGRGIAKALLRRAVETRLRIIAATRADPSIGAEPIERPVFVLGLPRTGTTLLFNLLAQDPDARPLLGWEAYHPVPKGATRAGRPDRRIRRHRRSVRALERLAPRFQSVHPVTAEGPEECLPLLIRGFASWAWPFYGRLPGYERWLWERTRDELVSTYTLHKTQLQFLQHQRGSGHWLLKSPAHLNGIEALLQVYPDACIVQTHRDVRRVIPSSCSLLGVARNILSDRVDPHELGREALELGARTMARTMAVRERLPADRIVDLNYADLVQDPLAAVHRVYGAWGRQPSAEMDDRMRAHMDAHPRHQKGVHRYSLEQFGIEEGDIEAGARAYHERFGVPSENA